MRDRKIYGLWVLANVIGWTVFSPGLYRIEDWWNWLSITFILILFIPVAVAQIIVLERTAGSVNWLLWVGVWALAGLPLIALSAPPGPGQSQPWLIGSIAAAGLLIGFGYWKNLSRHYKVNLGAIFVFVVAYIIGLLAYITVTAFIAWNFRNPPLSVVLFGHSLPGLIFGVISGLPFFRIIIKNEQDG